LLLQPAAARRLQAGLEPGSRAEPVEQVTYTVLDGARMRAELAGDGSVGEPGRQQAEQDAVVG
jgi:hypothetical protein